MSNIEEPNPTQPRPPAYAPPAGVAPTGGYPVARPPGAGQPGQIRGTGISILLYIVTFGFYGWFYYYKTHEEMKRHSGEGLGGPLALILAIFVGIAMAYLTPHEVGSLYKRAGKPEPVSAITGLWYFPGIFILVGPIIWFVKTNGALNDYWKSQGVAA